jgi:UPF0716 protein FxsA
MLGAVFIRLALLFTVVPLVELYLLIELGGVIGVLPTVAIVVTTGVLGAWLARYQGLKVLREIGDGLSEGRMPTESLIDGLLILMAGAVLLTPGLMTDALGFSLLVPRGRAVVRRAVRRVLERRVRGDQPLVIDAEWRRED